MIRAIGFRARLIGSWLCASPNRSMSNISQNVYRPLVQLWRHLKAQGEVPKEASAENLPCSFIVLDKDHSCITCVY